MQARNVAPDAGCVGLFERRASGHGFRLGRSVKAFYCDRCGNLVFFENVQCLQCSCSLGFLPDILDLASVEPDGNGVFRALSSAANGRLYRSCANGDQYGVCNWLIPKEDPNPLCTSCRLNSIIPDLADPSNLARWHKLELAKRRLLYSLLALKIDFAEESPSSASPSAPPLRFQFLAEAPATPVVQTGHSHGLITINIAEADDDMREKNRVSLREPFRTLLGHFRHESGHFYWERLVANSRRLNDFRKLFGDEQFDYAAALRTYYQNGAPTDWVNRNVSAYATAHPWEDWAETWAHYLHMIDTLETSASFGLSLRPRHPAAEVMATEPGQVANQPGNFDAMLTAWFPLTYALNELNRGMGITDLYPFILSAIAIEKLRFVHETIATFTAPVQRPPFANSSQAR